MHLCSLCKMPLGGVDQHAVYAFEGKDYCKQCMESVNMGWRVRVDSAVSENNQYKKRILSGTYMKPKEDILGYGKKNKEA